MKLKRNDLLAKLSAGDMVAIEAKYHARCLAKLYNEVRQIEVDEMSNKNIIGAKHGIVFAELVSGFLVLLKDFIGENMGLFYN